MIACANGQANAAEWALFTVADAAGISVSAPVAERWNALGARNVLMNIKIVRQRGVY